MTVRSDNSKGRSGPLGISGGTWRLLIIPVLLIMILPLGVNAYMFHADPLHTGIFNDVARPPNNVLKWVFNATDPLQTDSAIYASPAVVNNVVYVGSNNGFFYAINATDGTERWTFKETAGDIDSSAAVVGDVIYFGNYDYSVYALDLSGNKLWNYPTTGKILSSPTVVGNDLYIGTYTLNGDNGSASMYDGKVYALDVSTNPPTLKWAPYQTGGAIHSSPAVANGLVYITSFNNTKGDGTGDGKMYALNTSTGVLNWSIRMAGKGWSSPAVVNNVVYVGGGEDATVYALNALTGIENWKYPTGGGTIRSTPAVANGVVFVGDNDGNVYAIDVSTHLPIWTNTTTNNQIYSGPVVANGTVYVGSYDNNVYAFNALTGVKLWKYETHNSLYSSPAVANGVVYIGGIDGNVYAIGNWTSSLPPAPVAAFTKNTTSGAAPLTVQFNDTSTGGTPTKWNWSFGDGTWFNTTTPSLKNTTHTYTIEGTPSVTLTVSNDGGSSTSPGQQITVTTAAVTASKIGTTNAALGDWWLDYDGSGTWTSGDKNYHWGGAGYAPVVGDWNGDGKTEIGTMNAALGDWWLDYDGSGTWTSGDKNYHWGGAGYAPVIGDWNGDTKTEIGTMSAALGDWWLDYDGSGTWTSGDKNYHWGGAGYAPVVGKWS